jgi:hypothetical protein
VQLPAECQQCAVLCGLGLTAYGPLATGVTQQRQSCRNSGSSSVASGPGLVVFFHPPIKKVVKPAPQTRCTLRQPVTLLLLAAAGQWGPFAKCTKTGRASSEWPGAVQGHKDLRVSHLGG